MLLASSLSSSSCILRAISSSFEVSCLVLFVVLENNYFILLIIRRHTKNKFYYDFLRVGGLKRVCLALLGATGLFPFESSMTTLK
jgi:hypothetical protein